MRTKGIPNHNADKMRLSRLYQLDLFGNAKVTTAIPYVREAIKELIASLDILEGEMKKFLGPTSADIETATRSLYDQWEHRTIKLDGEDRDATIRNIVERKITYEQYFRDRFTSRFISIALPLVINSALLVEATINVVQQVALINLSRLDLFEGFEKMDIKAKWIVGPEVFLQEYKLDKSKSYHDDLVKLIKYRNSILHAKSEVYDSQGKSVSEGPKELRLDLGKAGRLELRKFSTLSDRLVDQLLTQVPDFDVRHSLSLCKFDFF